MEKRLSFCHPTERRAGAPAMPGHDAECDDRGLMPVFDFAQNRFEIFADRQPAFACNRDRRRRNVVAEFSPRAWLSRRA
jgi:hypothetical protein